MATSDYIKQGEVIRAADIIAAFDEKADQTYVDNTKAPINMAPSGTTASNTIPTNTTNPLTTILQTIINNLRWIFNNNLRNVANVIYPVGSIYMSVNSTDPGTLFGGTWTAWGQGRTIIGRGTSDQPFNQFEATGGESNHTLTTAEMPGHTHTGPSHSHSMPYSWLYNASTSGSGISASDSSSTTNRWSSSSTSSYSGGNTGSTGSGTAHNNLPPFIVCYMWKRTA
jgi:microcystin-dependent protein